MSVAADGSDVPSAARGGRYLLPLMLVGALAALTLAIGSRFIASPPASALATPVIALGVSTLHPLEAGEPLAIGSLPWRRQLTPRQFRRFRLDMPFTLEAQPAGDAWAAYFLTLNDGGRVLLNGVLVGEVPTSTEATAIVNLRPVLITMAPELLRPGVNVLSVEWGTHDSLQHLSAAYVGPLQALHPAWQWRMFWQNSMARTGFDFALVSAALLLGIHAMRRSERRYLLMGLTSLGWADVCLAYFLPPLPAGWLPAWHLLRLAGIASAACCTWLFVLHETRSTHRGLARLCIALALVGPLGYTANFVATGSIFAGTFEGVWGAVLLAFGILPLGLLGRDLLVQWNWRCAVIWFAVAAGLLAGLADISTMATGSGVLGGVGYIAPAVSPIWFTAIVIVLVRDFAESIAVQQQQNVLMAQRLAEQQQELLRLHAEEQRRARERAAEEERQRIMQDMHDGLGSQLLSSLALVERGELDPVQTGALLRECIDDLRIAIDSLAGHDDGFALMAGNLRFRMEPRLRAAGITLRWNSRGLDDRWPVPPTRSLPLLRILQEALGNALRHACATTIEVTLRHDADGALELEVSDDGRGFDIRRVRPGKGLAGIEKRVRSLGGAMSVVSGSDGTRLRVTVPVAADGVAS
ncbi:MAG: hypothetical protein JSR75_15260 [Proteobacteria bacterium]|nr:hypothetical protein [Pseudomonadota bacterium]